MSSENDLQENEFDWDEYWEYYESLMDKEFNNNEEK